MVFRHQRRLPLGSHGAHIAQCRPGRHRFGGSEFFFPLGDRFQGRCRRHRGEPYAQTPPGGEHDQPTGGQEPVPLVWRQLCEKRAGGLFYANGGNALAQAAHPDRLSEHRRDGYRRVRRRSGEPAFLRASGQSALPETGRHPGGNIAGTPSHVCGAPFPLRGSPYVADHGSDESARWHSVSSSSCGLRPKSSDSPMHR
ncbi:hypothetical protein DESC_830005 [Desulfosarcina cetonica]|nr:hypothetical protein DESC_830005 [Desulfosarcina cetonica]